MTILWWLLTKLANTLCRAGMVIHRLVPNKRKGKP